MKKLLFLFLLFCASVQAHWDDTFNDKGQIVATHDGADAEARNKYRKDGVFETSRLRFVPVTPNHVDAFLHGLFDDAEVMTHFRKGVVQNHDYVENELKEGVDLWDQSPCSWWALYERVSGQFIGGIALWHYPETKTVEVGYLLKKAFQGKGYVTEALNEGAKPYLRKIKPENFDIFYACTHPSNIASQKVLEKAGFERRPEKDFIGFSGNPRIAYEIPAAKLFEAAP